MMKHDKRIAVALGVLTVLSGCQPAEQIKSYDVAKESYGSTGLGSSGTDENSPAAESKPGRMLVAMIEHSGRVWFIKLLGEESGVTERVDLFRKFIESIEFVDGRPKWTLPERWLEKPGAGLRFATINTGQPGLDVRVISLPAPQEVLANVNRWRGQLQLADISESEMSENVGELTVGESKVSYIDIKGKISDGGSGMSPPFAGRDGGGAPFAPFAGGAGGRSMGSAASKTPPTASNKLAFDKPESWTQGRMNSMRKAAFDVKDDNGAAEFTVSTLAKAGADLLPNVNRWLGQVGLESVDEAGLAALLADVEVSGIDSKYVSLVGSEKSTLAVITIRDETAWFFKMMGDAATVASEKENFESFVSSVKFAE